MRNALCTRWRSYAMFAENGDGTVHLGGLSENFFISFINTLRSEGWLGIRTKRTEHSGGVGSGIGEFYKGGKGC